MLGYYNGEASRIWVLTPGVISRIQGIFSNHCWPAGPHISENAHIGVMIPARRATLKMHIAVQRFTAHSLLACAEQATLWPSGTFQ